MDDSRNKLKSEYELFVVKSNNSITALNATIAELNQTNSSLDANLLELKGKYESLSSSNSDLTQSYSQLKSEALGTISKIDAYESEIQKALEWFKENSVLSSLEINALVNLKSNCKEIVSQNCEINLGCFNLVNSEFVNYKYKSDLSALNIDDKLLSLSEFVKNGGGDCEDYTLFFKAEYNSLLNSCEKKVPVLFGWVESKGSTFWANSSNTWYLPNAEKKYLNKENIFPVGVCGPMFDPNTNKVNGHCVLAFANKPILSFSDISTLLSAELVEPQSGEYLGFVGKDSGIFLVTDFAKSTSFIDTLITDNDLFLYREGAWNNYSEFRSELVLRKNSLSAVLTN